MNVLLVGFASGCDGNMKNDDDDDNKNNNNNNSSSNKY
jgi:hypothetical protein